MTEAPEQNNNFFLGRVVNPLRCLSLQKNEMKHLTTISCPHCNGSDLTKNGHSENGTQRWRCNFCRKSFQLDYRYHARKPSVKDSIVEMTLNVSGVRDIGRVLKISTGTVTSELKKNVTCEPLRN